MQHGGSDYFEVSVGIGIDDGVATRPEERFCVGVNDGGLAESFLEVETGILAVAGDVLLDHGAEVFHLLIGPEKGAIGSDNADSFADGVENGAGLLIDGGALEGQEIGGFGDDGAEIVVLELFESFVDVVDSDDLGVSSKMLQEFIGLGALSMEDQDFALADL